MFIDPSPASLSPFEWLLHYIPGIGWPAVIAAVFWGAWKVKGFLDKMETRIVAADKTLTDLAKISLDLQDSLKERKQDMQRNYEAIMAVGKDTGEFKKEFGEHLKSDENNFKALRDAMAGYTLLSGETSRTTQQLMETIHHQTDISATQFNLLREIAERQTALAANQTNITSGFQRVVEQLINMMKE